MKNYPTLNSVLSNFQINYVNDEDREFNLSMLIALVESCETILDTDNLIEIFRLFVSEVPEGRDRIHIPYRTGYKLFWTTMRIRRFRLHNA
jgi:hypothetical protein